MPGPLFYYFRKICLKFNTIKYKMTSADIEDIIEEYQ